MQSSFYGGLGAEVSTCSRKNNYIAVTIVSLLPEELSFSTYRKMCSISHTLLGDTIVVQSDVVGASPTTTYSFSAQHLASMD